CGKKNPGFMRVLAFRKRLKREIHGGEGGFGVQNIEERLKLFFDDSCGLFYESRKDCGTRVYIKLPENK
ncbi:MAG: hypothetical protein LUD18_08245, partial [Lachnospiraceae bacterium]|nr:hypothetical protein [Lachnospiraceae bacterium]